MCSAQLLNVVLAGVWSLDILNKQIMVDFNFESVFQCAFPPVMYLYGACILCIILSEHSSLVFVFPGGICLFLCQL